MFKIPKLYSKGLNDVYGGSIYVGMPTIFHS